jgi:hypothetical protein
MMPLPHPLDSVKPARRELVPLAKWSDCGRFIIASGFLLGIVRVNPIEDSGRWVFRGQEV